MNKEERILKYINSADELAFSGKRYYENDFYNDVENLVKENQELKLELSGYRQAILEDKDMLGLKEENTELKKQLEEYKLITIDYQELEARNQELKKKYENAVADYETTMFEKEQLNSLVNSCQEEIRELKKQLEESKDKINWYENFEINKTIDKLRIKHNNQQKEFIEWLENGIEKVRNTEFLDERIQRAGLVAYNRVLQKYKEIIGDKQ